MNYLKSKRKVFALGLSSMLLGLFLSLGIVLAAGEQLPRSLVSGGGGQVSQGGLTLHSAVGQPVVGAVQNTLNVCSGYLCGPGAPAITEGGINVYLPLVVK